MSAIRLITRKKKQLKCKTLKRSCSKTTPQPSKQPRLSVQWQTTQERLPKKSCIESWPSFDGKQRNASKCCARSAFTQDQRVSVRQFRAQRWHDLVCCFFLVVALFPQLFSGHLMKKAYWGHDRDHCNRSLGCTCSSCGEATFQRIPQKVPTFRYCSPYAKHLRA